jgi:hypothetical protein
MKYKYKGHEYEIRFCDPSKDWRENSGMFYIFSAVPVDGVSAEYFDTYAKAKAEAERLIDAFLEYVPQSKHEWISALNKCIAGGSCDTSVDEETAWAILVKAAKYLEVE